jgi:hypothetical protein
MSPRVKAKMTQSRLRAPRIPSDIFLIVPFSRALIKGIFLFDQSFFITGSDRLRRLFITIVYRMKAFKKNFPQIYICFRTSVV